MKHCKVPTIAAWILTLVGILLGAAALKADKRPPTFITGWQIARQAVPTTAADISSLGSDIPTNTDLYVCQLDLSLAPGSGTVNVSIYDKQATPQYLFNAVPMTATASTGVSWTNVIRTNQDQGCPQFKGGMVVLASGAGVTIYVSGKY